MECKHKYKIRVMGKSLFRKDNYKIQNASWEKWKDKEHLRVSKLPSTVERIFRCCKICSYCEEITHKPNKKEHFLVKKIFKKKKQGGKQNDNRTSS